MAGPVRAIPSSISYIIFRIQQMEKNRYPRTLNSITIEKQILIRL